MAFSEVVSSVWRPCLFSAIGNCCSNGTKTFRLVYVTKFERIPGATLAALARGFSDRHFERGEGPRDEVAQGCYCNLVPRVFSVFNMAAAPELPPY